MSNKNSMPIKCKKERMDDGGYRIASQCPECGLGNIIHGLSFSNMHQSITCAGCLTDYIIEIEQEEMSQFPPEKTINVLKEKAIEIFHNVTGLMLDSRDGGKVLQKVAEAMEIYHDYRCGAHDPEPVTTVEAELFINPENKNELIHYKCPDCDTPQFLFISKGMDRVDDICSDCNYVSDIIIKREKSLLVSGIPDGMIRGMYYYLSSCPHCNHTNRTIHKKKVKIYYNSRCIHCGENYNFEVKEE